MWPLCGSRGEGGCRVPLTFGWEVPVSFARLARRSGKERGTRHGARDVFESGRKSMVWFNLVKYNAFIFGGFNVIYAVFPFHSSLGLCEILLPKIQTVKSKCWCGNVKCLISLYIFY